MGISNSEKIKLALESCLELCQQQQQKLEYKDLSFVVITIININKGNN
ncbi:MAG TPA: hypothetical protein VLG50_07210 [Candidatus Saccharimonadales bacterium]|nr:hypothetical protein [Candidatus Saccharimonadales bacterium]